MRNNSPPIPERLRDLRKQHRLTLRQLEKATGVSNAYLSQLERGLVINPSVSMLRKIAAALETTVDYLAGGGLGEKGSDHPEMLRGRIRELEADNSRLRRRIARIAQILKTRAVD